MIEPLVTGAGLGLRVAGLVVAVRRGLGFTVAGLLLGATVVGEADGLGEALTVAGAASSEGSRPRSDAGSAGLFGGAAGGTSADRTLQALPAACRSSPTTVNPAPITTAVAPATRV